MQPREAAEARALHNLLRDVPIAARQAALLASIIEDNPGAVNAVLAAVSVWMILARGLSADARAVIAERMRAEAGALTGGTQ
jgi:hypothetical protein